MTSGVVLKQHMSTCALQQVGMSVKNACANVFHTKIGRAQVTAMQGVEECTQFHVGEINYAVNQAQRHICKSGH